MNSVVPGSSPHLPERDLAYRRAFGETNVVFHERPALAPHVDVYVFEPQGDRGFFTLVTSGVSDVPMQPPPGWDEPLPRLELIAYAAEPRPEFANLLRVVGRFPHDHATWIGPYHTIETGPLFGSALDHVLLVPPPYEEDCEIASLTIEDAPVVLLWVVPIFATEAELARTEGSEALLAVCDDHGWPIVLDEQREPRV